MCSHILGSRACQMSLEPLLLQLTKRIAHHFELNEKHVAQVTRPGLQAVVEKVLKYGMVSTNTTI